MRTLKGKLLLLTSIVILGVTALLTGSSYWEMKKNLHEHVSQTVNLINTQTAGKIAEWLDGKKSAIAAVATAQPAADSLTQALTIAHKGGRFSLAYAGFDDGQMVYDDGRTPREGYDPRKRPWYQLAQQTEALSITKPYIDATTGGLVITVVQPGKDGAGKRYGVYGGDVYIDDIVKTVLALPLGKAGAAMLLDSEGDVIAYRNKEQVMKPFSQVIKGISTQDLTRLDSDTELTAIELEGENKLARVTHIAGSDWYLLSAVDPKEVFAPLDTLVLRAAAIALVTLLVCLLLVYLGVTRLLRPLDDVSLALDDMADGKGDLTRRLEVLRNDEIGAIATGFNNFINYLQPILQRVGTAGEGVRIEAGRANGNATDMAHEISQQQQEIDQVATAMQEMASTALEVARHAEETATAAKQSSSLCLQGMQQVSRNRDSIQTLASEIEASTGLITDLNKHAQSISSILTTIQGVSEQTNLLALNAAIEAARAGEQGRGFAVVADEVRELSQRAHKSTEEIQTVISQLQSMTKAAANRMEVSFELANTSVTDADAAKQNMNEVTQGIEQISQRSIQIASAAEEQRAVTDDISRNMLAIKEVADQLTAGATQTRQSSERLTQVAESLQQEMGKFRLH
ncbi:methyl-accepting chemotaxis protein [Pokkaliibacter sp. CJK22405]|uniref:methyl-accepting chemotaxis protein n=1 Tax=Pokkaliibacter sp. CJK22405 TaxID=3384615 RepID=UPI0039849A29